MLRKKLITTVLEQSKIALAPSISAMVMREEKISSTSSSTISLEPSSEECRCTATIGGAMFTRIHFTMQILFWGKSARKRSWGTGATGRLQFLLHFHNLLRDLHDSTTFWVPPKLPYISFRRVQIHGAHFNFRSRVLREPEILWIGKIAKIQAPRWDDHRSRIHLFTVKTMRGFQEREKTFGRVRISGESWAASWLLYQPSKSD